MNIVDKRTDRLPHPPNLSSLKSGRVSLRRDEKTQEHAPFVEPGPGAHRRLPMLALLRLEGV